MRVVGTTRGVCGDTMWLVASLDVRGQSTQCNLGCFRGWLQSRINRTGSQ